MTLKDQLNAAHKSLQYCERVIEQLERSNHALSQALQVFVPILHEDLSTHSRAELNRALKMIEPLEAQAAHIRSLLGGGRHGNPTN